LVFSVSVSNDDEPCGFWGIGDSVTMKCAPQMGGLVREIAPKLGGCQLSIGARGAARRAEK